MRSAAVLLITVLFAFGCTTPPDPHKRTRHKTQSPEVQQKKTPPAPKPEPQQAPKSSKPKAQYTRPPVQSTPALTGPRKFLLPTVIHHRDQSVMVRVPPGSYWVPSEAVAPLMVGQNERLAHKTLRGFFIDQTEITVAQYQRFNPNYDETVYTGGAPCPQCPAMAINWMEAQRYCQWAGKRLPTEDEWEAAARGTSQYKFPWGDRPLENSANILGDRDGFTGAAPAGSFARGASPLGVLDMIGNVWEWVSTTVVLSSLAESQPGLQGNSRPVVKGGGWSSPPDMATISYRNLVDPQIHNPTFGFRCAKPATSGTDPK